MLTNKILKINELSKDNIDVMYHLMNQYYDNTHKETFIKDLNAKKGVLLVFNDRDKLCGFTTYDLFKTHFNNEVVNVLYSGDTIISDEYWGHIHTSKMFMSLIKKCREDCEGHLYWFLITKGIRTYRLLPLYFREYYPNYREETPNYEDGLIKFLAKYKFQERYVEKDGVIRFEENGDCLKGRFCQIDQNKKGNQHVNFFINANPGFINGDNLPCIAQISWDNLTDRALRFIDESVEVR